MTGARAAFARREAPGRALAGQSATLARACYDMAVRFHRGGTLIVFGNGGGATDAQHLSVEFVHPVIVGKRALPALSLAADAATLTGVARADGFAETFARPLRLLGRPPDIALGLSADGRCANVARALEVGRELGMLTIALAGGGGGQLAEAPYVDHLVTTDSTDSTVVKEVHVTAYHVLWELVHVFFEHPGVLAPEVVA